MTNTDFEEQPASDQPEPFDTAPVEQPLLDDQKPFQVAEAKIEGPASWGAKKVEPLRTEPQPRMEGPADWGAKKVEELAPPKEKLDTETGVPFGIRTMFHRAENPAEAKKVLEKYYGEGKTGQDAKGNWWVEQDGKKVAVGSGGPDPTVTKAIELGKLLPGPLGIPARVFEAVRPALPDPAPFAATATPMAGATLGAGLGVPGGPFGVAAGLGAGAAVGWGADQLVKYYQGLYDQTPIEAAKHALNEANLNMALGAAAPVAKAVARGAGQGLRSFLGTTPETRALTGQLEAEGAHPPIVSAAPDFKSFADKQKLRNLVHGDPWDASNTAFVKDKFEQAMRSSGVPDQEISRMMAEAQNPLSAPQTTAIGTAVVERAQQHVGNLRAEATASLGQAQQQLQQMDAAIRQWSNAPVGRLGQDVADAIVNSRREFGQAAGRAYRSIDQMTGDAPVFPLEAAFREARTIVDLAEPGTVPPYVRQLAARGERVANARAQIAELESNPYNPQPVSAELRAAAAGGDVTFAEAHEIRNNLREILGDLSLTRTPYLHKISNVEDAINDTFRALEGSQGLGADAARFLRQTDATYGRGINVFKDGQINTLVKQVRSGLIPDPEVVASTILREGREESSRQILAMLPQNVRTNVARVDLRNIVDDASHRGPDGRMMLDGDALLAQIEKRGPLFSDLHSPQAAADLTNMGRQLLAIDGKLDVTNLPPGQISAAIQNYIQRIQQIDHFVTQNPLGALANGTPEMVDRAAMQIARPGAEAATQQAMEFLGATSPQWQLIQRKALSDLVRASTKVTPARGMTISGNAIENELKRYTAAQQEMLFPQGLADDLKVIAKQARFLFPPGIGTGANELALSQAARSITLHTGLNLLNPRTAYADTRWLYTKMMGWIIDRPGVLRVLADTARSQPSEVRTMLGAIGRYVVNAETTTGPGKERTSPAPRKVPKPRPTPFKHGGSLKQPKAAVDYGKGMPSAHCGICAYFHRNGVCDKVQGTVKAEDWCRLYKARRRS